MLGTLAATRYRYRDLRPRSARSESPARVVVLVSGANPTFDYYIKPRLGGCAHLVVDIDRTSPRSVELCGSDYVLVCRYLSPRWMRKLRRATVAGLGLLLDDDYLAFIRDRRIPLLYRMHVARYGIGAMRAVGSQLTDLFVSTRVLKDRFPEARAVVVGPLSSGCDFPSEASRRDRLRIAYHAQRSHLGDHAFCADLLRRVAASEPSVDIEVIGPAAARPLWRGIPQVRFHRETDWDSYRRRAVSEGADIFLAPLLDTPLNRARAPTKAIETARLGAAGIFADMEPYESLQGAAPLVGPDLGAWESAVTDLIASSEKRQRAAARLRQAVASWQSERPPPWLA